MKVLVIYDSYFGNTEAIAKAISESISSKGDVQALKASDVNVELLRNVDVVVFGSPTRAFRPTKTITNLIDGLSKDGLKGVKVTAFDTRISTKDINSKFLNVMTRAFGYAAKPLADRLVKKGGSLAVPPEGFFVKDSEGPLKDGELERAKTWAKKIVS